MTDTAYIVSKQAPYPPWWIGDMLTREFFLHCQAKGLRQRSVDFYRDRLAVFQRHLKSSGKTWETATRDDVTTFICQRLGYVSAGTVNCDLRALFAFYNWCFDNDLLPAGNPICRLHLVKVESRIRPVLTVEQIQRIMNSFDQRVMTECRDRTMILVMLDGCLRAGELCSLNIEDLDLANRMLTVRGKSRVERFVPISPRTAQTLHLWLLHFRYKHGKTGPVFLLNDGRPMTGMRIARLLGTLSHTLGFRVHAHMLRRTGATLLANHGANLEFIRRILGHTDIRTTVGYITASADDLRTAHDRYSPLTGIL